MGIGEIIAITILSILSFFLGGQLFIRHKTGKLKGKPVPEKYLSDIFFQSGPKKILYFYSDSCGPCRAMSPSVEAVKEKYPDRIKKVNLAHDTAMFQEFSVMGTPTTIVIQDGKIVDILLGISREKKLIAALGL